MRTMCYGLHYIWWNKKYDSDHKRMERKMKVYFLKVFNIYRVSSTLATSCEELTHWKRLWCWEGLGAGGKGDDRGWDGWMASLTRWTWVWVNFGSWWWTGRPGVLRFMGSQRIGHDWAAELNWKVPVAGGCCLTSFIAAEKQVFS